MISTSVIVICLIGMVLQACFIMQEHKENYLAAVIFKGSAALMFVLVGIMGFRASNSSYSKIILWGLCFGALGDILLNLRYLVGEMGQKVFLAGIASFFTGHIMYLVALVPTSKHLFISVVAGVIAAALLLVYIFRKLTVKPAFKIFGIFYIGAIIIMTAVAIDNLLTYRIASCTLFAIGAILFTVSDIVLIFNTFGEKTTLGRRIANLTCYYIAQLLIAMTTGMIK